MMRQIRAPRSFHIPATSESAFASAARAFVLQSPSRPTSASRYPMWSPVQYFSRAWSTSSSNGTFFSKSHSRADAGSTPLSTANRFVHSAAV